MITPEKIDRVVNRFDADIKAVETRLIERIRKVVTSQLTDAEIIEYYSQIDFFQEMQQAGYGTALNRLEAEYALILDDIIKQAKKKGLDKIAGVGIANLDTLISSNMEAALRSGAFVSEQLRSGLLSSLIAGTPRKRIAEEILPRLQEQIPFNPIWLKTAINQFLTAYQNTAIAAVFEDAPQTKFKLIHIFDKDTRPLCKHAIERQKEFPDGLTIEEINSGELYKGYSKRYKSEPDNYDFENRGGYNCRGYWELVSIND